LQQHNNSNSNNDEWASRPMHTDDEINPETTILNSQSQQENQEEAQPQQENQEEDRGTRRPQWIQHILNQYDSSPVKRNESWGASINNVPPTVFGIYFQNINGLQHKTSNSRWQPHLEYMKQKGISISGLAETNSNWHHKNLTRQIRVNARNVFNNSSVVFAENSFNPPDRSAYLPICISSL
jgi:hypothetical protein